MRPNSEWHPSPNFRAVTPDRKITCIVLHATATSGIDSPLAWLCNPESKVSAHYLISRTGVIFHLVHEVNVAWHAGESTWKGKPGVNAYSIGIELVNANDGKMEYPEDQLRSCADLVRSICQERNIQTDNVVGHMDIAPGRKTDPAGFPWANFRARLVPGVV